jgi:hypothetical protein
MKDMNKKYLKGCLKDGIKNWLFDLKNGTDCYDESMTFMIKYTNNEVIYFNYSHEGNKPSLLNIENIYLQTGYESIDFNHSLIGTKEMIEDYKEYGCEEVPSNVLIVNEMNDYFLQFENEVA